MNVLLINFESVRPKSLAALDQNHFKVLVFVGEGQKVTYALPSVG